MFYLINGKGECERGPYALRSEAESDLNAHRAEQESYEMYDYDDYWHIEGGN